MVEGGFSMMRFAIGLAGALAFGAGGMAPAQARGCLKGAAVGGVAGHMAGHGVMGAAAGCAIGHHEAAKRERRDQQDQQPQRSN
jgi:hypothetical protein